MTTNDPNDSRPIRVLVIDDSALMRKLLTDLLGSDPGIDVVGTAMDAYAAREKIKKLNPDVITLDVEMPKMDGLTFLRNLMRLRPMPVVMISSLTQRGAQVAMQAMDLGAADFVPKPKVDVAHGLDDCAAEIIEKVKAASQAKVERLVAASQRVDQPQVDKQMPASAYRTTDRVIAIGASTGGTEAIKEVLVRLSADVPGIVIAQHIPPVFSRSFADRMDQCSRLSVCEAEDGQQIRTGHAYVAPGDRHLEVVRDGARYRCRLTEAEPVNRHRPSVDVLFDSVSENVGGNALGIILTGMGKDGALGLKRMRDRGARTIGQDEASSVVWGMPKAAVAVEAVERVLPLESIAHSLTEWAAATTV